jgi:hypothetical protein
LRATAREISALRRLAVPHASPVPAPAAPHEIDERRRHRRRRSFERAWFDSKTRAVYVRLWDISRGGVSVRGAMPFSDGETLTVTLGGVRVRAEVSWRSERPVAGTGFRFVEVLDGEDELIALTGGPLLY